MLKAQQIQVFNLDSMPIRNVLIANITMDETVFTNRKGEADLTIFQDEDELLQLTHKSYQTLLISKKELTQMGKLFLFKRSNKIAPVQVAITSKTKESTYELITQTKTISSEVIQQQAPATTADLIEGTGEVQVQKTQLGGGSPILRGFEASRVLLIVDGVRMNNAIYRSGHLHNSISIDPNMLEGVEIIFGPNSLMYGSDALGGVIHFKSKEPQFKTDSSSVEFINGTVRYQSAMNGKTMRFSYQNGNRRFAYLIGGTQNKFGDLRMGNKRFHGFDDFGKIDFFIDQVNGQDSIVENEDKNRLKRSGYSQNDILWKGCYKYNPYTVYKINFQYSFADFIPRLDKLYEENNGQLKYAEWNYTDNKRALFSVVKETKKRTKLYDYNSFILAHQKIIENRMNREYQSLIHWKNLEDVSVYSFNADFIKYLDSLKTTKINFGAEGVFNFVASDAFGEHRDEEEYYPLITRYPGKGSEYHSGAAYLAVQKKIKQHLIKGGMRYTYTHLESRFDTNLITNALDLTNEKTQNNAFTSSIGYIFKKGNDKFYSSLSTAFKSPNIDDFGKVFEKSGNLTIPNTELRPETSINLEIGTNLIHHYIDFELAAYCTKVFNLMTKLPTEINGTSTFNLANNDVQLVSLQNSGSANIYGLHTAFRLKFNNLLNWTTTTTFTKGAYDNSDQPVGHIPPIYGKSELSYKLRKYKFSLYTRFNSRKKWKNFNTLSDNPNQAVLNFGTPAWMTLNTSAFVYAHPRLKLQMAFENILDAHYKTFASAISAPGRNIILTAYFKF